MESNGSRLSGTHDKRFADFEPLFKNLEGHDVLDIGCHCGALGFVLDQYCIGSYTGIDNNKEKIAAAKILLAAASFPTSLLAESCLSSNAVSLVSRGYDTIFVLNLLQYLKVERDAILEFLKFLAKSAKSNLVIRCRAADLGLVAELQDALAPSMNLSFFSSLNPTNVNKNGVVISVNNQNSLFVFTRALRGEKKMWPRLKIMEDYFYTKP